MPAFSQDPGHRRPPDLAQAHPPAGLIAGLIAGLLAAPAARAARMG